MESDEATKLEHYAASRQERVTADDVALGVGGALIGHVPQGSYGIVAKRSWGSTIGSSVD
jgi:hypothetical protein